MQNPHLLPIEEPEALAATLETLLHGYLHYAFQTGTSATEAMAHYENALPLIQSLQRLATAQGENTPLLNIA